ncbi:hypothetical protein FIV42_14265 [Persicimonas caeni]|uniref:Uncharacterized protein n=1 Tax=Persicimonas caeni TaxID=2292766 RepID=A0A4Y6PU62_PERCE|nr:hypothetical protein [Persicimonas caeni]QDG51861.1 hypothetical protein FIV42_14265 [Persicimonas caeni]QED33082.1 hypothetical protein FRD00_14260 [Persicimonas caeni]
MMRLTNATALVGALILGAGLSAGCSEDDFEQPASLQSPRAMTIARGQVCMTSSAPFGGAVRPVLSECGTTEEGVEEVSAIGLVANQTGNSVGVIDMTRNTREDTQRTPRLVDLDPAVPGVTHIPVGNSPVDVAAGTGTTAYAVNQADASVSVINLTVLKALQDDIVFDEAPKKVVVTPKPSADAPGTLVVALTNPSRLWTHDEVECAFPQNAIDEEGNIDRDQAPADTGCDDVPTQDAGQTIALPGTVSDLVVGPTGDLVYAVYTDANFASVFAVTDTGLDTFDDGCLEGDAAPCEVARVGLTFGCSDGIDNEGDGLVDQNDPQCYGPRGSESPDGIGRTPQGECSDGVDNEEGQPDGLIDRQDPDCLYSGGAEDAPIVADATLACMDGRDNDDDGQTDYPADDACYGDVGRTERAAEPLGYTSVSIDPAGNFLYAVDQANNQVIVVDATRLELIDAFDAGGRDRTPFSSQLGISVPPAPTAVDALVERDVTWQDPQDDSHYIVRYVFGAFVATDGGFVYNLNAASVECEVTDPAAEANCLDLPAFPIEYDVEECLGGEGTLEEVDCAGERLVEGDGFRQVVNPNFQLQDSSDRQSRVRGLGTCENPQVFVDALRASLDGPVDVSCTSPLRPQPIDPFAASVGDDALAAAIEDREFDRASLLQQSTLGLEPTDEGSVAVENFVSVADQAIVQESVTVTWEGVIPGTNRDDGIVAEEPGELTVVGLDLCETGVQEGDRLTILSTPVDPNGEIPSQCDIFVDDQDARDFRTWEISEVRPDALVLSVIAEEDEGENFVDELPSRGCFAEGVRYEIRANDEWIVVGDRSGFLSDRTSVLGTCQPKFGADDARFNARVQTGELFEGPYFSFQLFEGFAPEGAQAPVDPARSADEEFSYRFSVERNFSPDSYRTTTVLPTQVLAENNLPAGRWLIVPDPASNFIYFRALDIRGDEGVFLLQ